MLKLPYYFLSQPTGKHIEIFMVQDSLDTFLKSCVGLMILLLYPSLSVFVYSFTPLKRLHQSSSKFQGTFPWMFRRFQAKKTYPSIQKFTKNRKKVLERIEFESWRLNKYYMVGDAKESHYNFVAAKPLVSNKEQSSL